MFAQNAQFKEKLPEKRDVIFSPNTKQMCMGQFLGFQIRKQMPLLSNNKIEIRLFF